MLKGRVGGFLLRLIDLDYVNLCSDVFFSMIHQILIICNPIMNMHMQGLPLKSSEKSLIVGTKTSSGCIGPASLTQIHSRICFSGN